MSFQIGDKVIYPNHGLGVVEKVEEKTILGTTTGFFHLRIISNETTVLVPVANVDNVGLRRAITDEEVERLFQLLGDGNIDNHQNWKGRFKDNSDKMRTGSIYDMADVLKSLTFLAKSKSLSFREKRMLDRAKSLIVSEISEVMRLTAASIEDRVNEALEKCFVTKAAAPKQAPVKVTPPAPPVYAPAPVRRGTEADRRGAEAGRGAEARRCREASRGSEGGRRRTQAHGEAGGGAEGCGRCGQAGGREEVGRGQQSAGGEGRGEAQGRGFQVRQHQGGGPQGRRQVGRQGLRPRGVEAGASGQGELM